MLGVAKLKFSDVNLVALGTDEHGPHATVPLLKKAHVDEHE